MKIPLKTITTAITAVTLSFIGCGASLISLPALASTTNTTALEMCSLDETHFIRMIKKESTNKSGKPELGAITVVAFSISNELNGPQIGLAISRRLDLALTDITPGPNSMMETAVTNFLPDGTLVTLQVTDYDSEKMADLSRAVVGGTGKYMGANGTCMFKRVEDGERPAYKANCKLEVPCGK